MQEIEWNKLPSHSLNLKIYISIKFDHKIQRFIGYDEDLLETVNVCVLLPCEFLFCHSPFASIFTAKFKFILVWLPPRSSKLSAAFINLTKGIYPSRIYSHKTPQLFSSQPPSPPRSKMSFFALQLSFAHLRMRASVKMNVISMTRKRRLTDALKMSLHLRQSCWHET